MKEGEGRIEIKDFPHEVIEACLRFMYSGRLNVQRRLLVEVAAFRDKYAISEHLNWTIPPWEGVGEGVGERVGERGWGRGWGRGYGKGFP